MERSETPMDARASARVQYQVRALLALTTQLPGGNSFGEPIYEVSTRDMSEGGALILGSRQLRVGQETLFRVGTGSGLVLSLRGQVVRRGNPCASPHACEWGIQFNDADAKLLRQHSVLAPEFSSTMYSQSHMAAIVSTDHLEMFWWLTQLSSEIREVLVSTNDLELLQRLRNEAPHLNINQLLY